MTDEGRNELNGRKRLTAAFCNFGKVKSKVERKLKKLFPA